MRKGWRLDHQYMEDRRRREEERARRWIWMIKMEMDTKARDMQYTIWQSTGRIESRELLSQTHFPSHDPANPLAESQGIAEPSVP